MGDPRTLSRRAALEALGLGCVGAVLGRPLAWSLDRAPRVGAALRQGAAPNPYWNSLGPLVAYPEKLPLIVLTDRPVQLETPRQHFLTAFTPNAAFYVRWHLDAHPNAVDVARWRLRIEGNVQRTTSFSLEDLVGKFAETSVTAVNQCSGNSRSRFQPRVPGGQWGNGGMGCATWTGVRLAELLAATGVKPGSVQVQFEGLDRGRGPAGRGSHRYLKSLRLDDPVLDRAIVAYAMNGEPLPLLNGFPVRLVVPGYFATYWLKALTWIRVLTAADENFWMKSAYRVPDTARGTTTPADVRAGSVHMVPIGWMPVRSFIVTPDGSTKVPLGLPVTVRGVAFSGHGRLASVQISEDDGRSWTEVILGADYGALAFRTWEYRWTPHRVGRVTLAVRATDERGNVQPDEPVWNPGGYLWNRIERQEIVVGPAA